MHISMATKQEMSAILPARHRVLLNYSNLDVIQFQGSSHIFSLVVKSSDVESKAVQSGREEIAIDRPPTQIYQNIVQMCQNEE